MTYAREDAPFHFSGTLTEKQKNAMEEWVDARKENFGAISVFHRIRAHQLRKAAGLLEVFYATRGLKPSFAKDPWVPDKDGHFMNVGREDFAPTNAIVQVKDRMQDQFAADDAAQFRMNFLRTRIEAHEDMAQEAYEGRDHVEKHLQDLDACFSDPNYRGACVREDDTYEGEPRFRVHPLDPPTPWERLTGSQALLKP